MADNNDIKLFADNLWNFYLKDRVAEMMRTSLSYFKAEVVTAPSNGKVGVKRPFEEDTIVLPISGGADTLEVGDNCLVMVFGELSNAFVVGKADLSTFGGGGTSGTQLVTKQVTIDAGDRNASIDYDGTLVSYHLYNTYTGAIPSATWTISSDNVSVRLSSTLSRDADVIVSYIPS